MKTDYQNLEAELKAYVDRHELNVDIVGRLQQQIISLEAEQKQLNEELVGNSKMELAKEYYLQIEALREQEDCLQLQLEEQEYEIERLRNIAHSPSAGVSVCVCVCVCVCTQVYHAKAYLVEQNSTNFSFI